MKRGIKAAIWSSLYIVFMVVLPRIALGFIPKEIMAEMSRGFGLDLGGPVSTITLVGIILAALSIAKNMAEEQSPVKPIVSSTGTLIILYTTLYFLGFGDPSTFGLTKKIIDFGEGNMGSLLLDVRFIVSLASVTATLKITHTFMKFYYSRKDRQAQITVKQTSKMNTDTLT